MSFWKTVAGVLGVVVRDNEVDIIASPGRVSGDKAIEMGKALIAAGEEAKKNEK